MTKKILLVIAAMLVLCATASAQTPGYNAAGGHWVVISAAFGMAIASGLCGLAQGKAIAAAVEGMARNPGAAKPIQLAMLIGLAFVESLALFTLVMIFSYAK